MKPILIALLSALAANAAVPVRWTVDTSRAAPVAIEQFAGTSIDLEAALKSYGSPLEVEGEPRLYWQTNGMGSAWWSAPASASGCVLRASWTPACEAGGAASYRGFIGIPGSVYSAAFTLRLRPSPGATPNALPLPTPRIDFSAVEVANAPWLEEESDPTVPAWAKAASKPTYTAAEVGALPLVEDANGNKTAVTIGIRTAGQDVGAHSFVNGIEGKASGGYSHAEGGGTIASGDLSHAEGCGTTASGDYSHAEGYITTALKDYSHAEGYYTTASGDGSHAEGYYTTASGGGSHAEGYITTASGDGSHAEGYCSHTRDGDNYSFAWNGDTTKTEERPYTSNGPGTFNINPAGGLSGFYIGEQTLEEILTNKADTADISATDPAFSNAVLAVGLNIDTNSVAVLNEIAATFGGFPIEGTATTVGGLLAALAAAAAWLKKNKADKNELDALASKVDAANAALEESLGGEVA